MNEIQKNFDLDSACIPPQSINNTTVNGTGIALDVADSLVAICYAGALASGGALAWKLQQATTVDGTYKDISGKTASHTDTDDNTIELIEVKGSELDVANGYKYVRLVVTESGSAACLVCGAFVRGNARYLPI